MTAQTIKLSPSDHGRRMSLADFEHAEVQEGRLYELDRGIVIVSDVPGPRYLMQKNALWRHLHTYGNQHPTTIHYIAGGSDCKIPLADLESERHPDLAIYKDLPPEGEDFWAAWIPEIVIEIVSPGSKQSDYVEKREEYLRFGVREYWIIDAACEEILVLRRSGGRWIERTLRVTDTYRTRLLPDFVLACAPVFEAARSIGE